MKTAFALVSDRSILGHCAEAVRLLDLLLCYYEADDLSVCLVLVDHAPHESKTVPPYHNLSSQNWTLAGAMGDNDSPQIADQEAYT